MIDVDLTPAGRNRAAVNSFGVEQVESDRGSDDVDDRVDGPHLVKVNRIDRRSVHTRFGGGHCGEESLGQILLSFSNRIGPVDERDDVRVLT